MPDILWRVVERHLRRSVPSVHLVSILGDLAEDYGERRTALGPLRARLWLIHEARSLIVAYRAAIRSQKSRLMLLDDLHHAWKRLVSRPAMPLLCAALLALGTGLSTSMFSVVDALLFQPAPFRDAERLVRQTFFRPEPAVMEAWRTSGMFEAVEAARLAPFQLESEVGGGRWRGAWLTPGTFELLGVGPLYGRVFAADAGAGAIPEILLSAVIWRAAFAADRSVLGRRIRLDEGPAVVVGIMPEDFRFPEPATLVWRAFVPSATETGPATVVGRLRPGIPLAVAETRMADMARQSARIPRNYRGTPPVQRVDIAPLGEFTQRALWLLLGGVALVFVVLCANVSSLLLARLSARRREFGVCAALGAARRRLIQQAMAEHIAIGIAGASAGVALASSLTSAVPEAFLGRTLNPIDIDVRALIAASILGVAAVVLSGVVPAWLGTRTDPMDALRRSGQGNGETRTGRIVAAGLLVGETALACSLLIGSAFLVQSFVNLVHADRGLNTAGVTHVRLNLRSVGGDVAARITGRGDTALLASLQAVRRLALASVEAEFSTWPEIGAAALSQELPPVTGGGRGSVRLGEDDEAIPSDGYRVGASFLELYGIRILRGRGFEAADTDRDIILGERLAGMLWPGLDPVGRTFAIGRTSRRVIGVASEIRLPTLDSSLDRPEFYQPIEPHADTVYLSLRCDGACPDEPAIRSRIAAVQRAIDVRMVPAWENEYLAHLRLPKATAQIGGLFAVVSVLTAAGGLFSLLTCAIGRRRREFGIRTALGASPRQMARLVFRHGLTVVGVGVFAGALGGWFVARSLASLHYGVSLDDPLIWSGVLGTIALVSIAASWRPALEAMRVDPVRLLREE
jgi:predicted permease